MIACSMLGSASLTMVPAESLKLDLTWITTW